MYQRFSAASMKPCRVIALMALVVAMGGCASTPIADERLAALVSENVMLAQAHLDQGEMLEGYQLIQAGAALNPTHPQVLEILEAVESDRPSLMMPSALGVNRFRRPKAPSSLAKRIILYLPDRFLDLLDIVGLDVHLGPGIYLNYHLTRALQVGGGVRTVAGLGWHTKRSLGLLGQAEAGLSVLAAGAQTYNAGQVGTAGVQAGSFHQAGLHKPTDPVYQEMRDYWAVGADTTILILGASWDLHPVEVIDFLTGFFLRDFLHDDLSATRRLHFTNQDKNNFREITSVLKKHRDAVEAYREAQP